MLKVLTILIFLVLLGGFAIYKGWSPMQTKLPSKVTPTPEVLQEEKNITVVLPVTGSSVSSPFIVKGSARVFENVVSIELTDDKGSVLFEGTAMADAPDVGQFGPYEKDIEFSTTAGRGMLTVYQASAKDGSRIDVVTIPVIFK